MENDSTAHPRDDRAADLDAVTVWEDRWAWPLFAGAILMFACTTWLLVEETPGAVGLTIASLAIVVLWALFIVDYLIRLRLAGPARRRFVRTRAFDAATLVLPFLRPFLIIVYVWRLPYFRYGSSAVQRGLFLATTVVFVILFVYTAAWGVWLVERTASGSSIRSFGDALFWGFTTITTVGYGDMVPVTLLGRVLAVGLMLGGVAVIGVTSATIVSALNDRIHRVAEAARARATQGEPPEER
ncbi:potassium channel family protein [Microbacterium awajiense]